MTEQQPLVPKLRFEGFTDAWEQRKLGDAAGSFTYGLNASAKPYDGVNKYLRITDIDDSTREFSASNLTSPDCDLASASNFQLREGDILFARTGATVGKSYRYRTSDGKVYFAGYLIRAQVVPEFNTEFVYQNTLTRRYDDFIKITSQRSGQPGVNAQEYTTFPLNAPSLVEQQQLGKLFETLDELIALQKRKAESARLLKLALGQHLFPVSGATVPTIRLSSFTNDWVIRQLGEVANIVGGGTPDTKVPEYWSGDIDWYTPAEIGHQKFVDNSQRKITADGLANSSAKFLPIGTVLFTSRAGIGNTAILAKESTTNQGFQSIVPKQDILYSYFIFARTAELKRYGKTVGAGSTFVEVSGKQMEKMNIAIPEYAEQEVIGRIFCALDCVIANYSGRATKLEQLKTTLLQQMHI